MGHNLDRARHLWAGMRAWPEVDRSPLPALTTAPLVMEYLPGTLRADQCDTPRWLPRATCRGLRLMAGRSRQSWTPSAPRAAEATPVLRESPTRRSPS